MIIAKKISTMDIVKKMRADIIKYIESADETTIRGIYGALENEQTLDWWNELDESVHQSINRGLNDEKEGRLTPHADVMHEYKKWLAVSDEVESNSFVLDGQPALMQEFLDWIHTAEEQSGKDINEVKKSWEIKKKMFRQ